MELLDKLVIPDPIVVNDEPLEEETKPGRIVISPQGRILRRYLKYENVTSDIIGGYNAWVREGIPYTMKNIAIPLSDGNVVTFGPIYIDLPHISEDGKKKPMSPSVARQRQQTYSFTLYSHISIRTDYDPNDPCVGQIIDQTKYPKDIGSIPVQLRSDVCYLAGKTSEELIEMGEDPRDPFSYFIIRGAKKNIEFDEMLRVNDPVILAKDGPSSATYSFTADTKTGTVVTDIIISKHKEKKSRLNGMLTMNFLLRSLPSIRSTSDSNTGKHKHRSINVITLIRAVAAIHPELNIKNTDEILNIILMFIEEKDRNNVKNELSTQILYSAITSGDPVSSLYTVISSSDAIEDENEGTTKKATGRGRKSSTQLEQTTTKPVLSNKIIREEKVKAIEEYFNRGFLSHISDYKSKVYNICMMIAMLTEYLIGVRSPTDRDRWGSKRLRSPGKLMDQLFRSRIKKMIKQLTKDILKIKKGIVTAHQIAQLINAPTVTDGFTTSFTSRYWGSNTVAAKTDVVKPFSPDNMTHAYSMILRINVPADRNSTNSAMRSVQNDQWGYVGPAKTPESTSCGVVKARAITAKITTGKSPGVITRYIHNRDNPKVVDRPSTEANTKLLINGIFNGWCAGRSLQRELRSMKIRGGIDRHTCVYLDINNYLRIHTDEGRLVRPLLVIDNGIPIIESKKLWGAPFDELIQKGAVEYVDALEQSGYRVATSIAQINHHFDMIREVRGRIRTSQNEIRDDVMARNSNNKDRQELKQLMNNYHTHMELHPQALFGVSVSMMPYPEFVQGPRIAYQGSMGDQALSTPNINHLNEFGPDIKILANPALPHVRTQTEDIFQGEISQGVPLVAAFMSFRGNTQEDAFIMNEDTIKSGRLDMYKFYTIKVDILNSNEITEILGIPKTEDPTERYRYRYLTNDGLPMLNAPLKKGDYIVGKLQVNRNGDEVKYKSTSKALNLSQEGIVTKISIIGNRNGNMQVRIKLRSYRIPQKGDKFSSRFAQKGTIGEILPARMMPYDKDTGTIPDIIMNPHSVSKRMTMGYPIEALVGTAAVITGQRYNGTAFEPFDINKFYRILQENGFNDRGNHTFIDPSTGKEVKCQIFMGIIHYQALRHHAVDKIQVRAEGPVKEITRQPNSGGKHGGGLRFGIFERLAVISHGAIKFADERLNTMSDAYTTTACKNCGTFSDYNAYTGVHKCNTCNVTGDKALGKVRLPYVYKLTIQLLGGMGIKLTNTFATSEEAAQRRAEREQKVILPEEAHNINGEDGDFDEDIDEDIDGNQEEFLEDFAAGSGEYDFTVESDLTEQT